MTARKQHTKDECVMHEEIYGNGQPGLKATVHTIKFQMQLVLYMNTAILISVVGYVFKSIMK